MLTDKKIAILGMGKIGGNLAGSLIRNGVVPADSLCGTTAHQESAQIAADRYGISVGIDGVQAIQGCDIVVLAVKPQNMSELLAEIKPGLKPHQILITLAAAISTSFIEGIVGDSPVIRAMSNTPCLVNAGMTVLCPGKNANDEHVQLARAIFSAVGEVEVIDNEELMDAVTALSGSGPAYAYIIIESLAEGGVRVGLPRDLATKLATQTLLGSAKMVSETGEHPAKLKDNVTTPAGTTVDGIMALEEGGVRVALIKAIEKATSKSKDLSQ